MMPRLLRCALALAGCLAAGGCATTLDSVLVDGERPAERGEMRAVQVLRGGAPLRPEAGMALQPGDLVQTGPRAVAVLRFPSGTEVFLRPNSRARIGSLRELVGEAFARVRGAFSIETEFVRAGAEGTAFLVRGAPAGETTVLVFDGRVVCESLRGRWPPIRLVEGDKFVDDRDGRPLHVRATRDELREVEEWVSRVERAVSRSPTGGQVAGGVAIAALVAAILASQDRDRDDAAPQPRPQPQPQPQPQPPGAPGQLRPGSTQSTQPPNLYPCRGVRLDWASVPGARSYAVAIDASPLAAPRRWTSLQRRDVTSTDLDAGWLRPGMAYRWSVQARDAQGRAGAPSPWLYFDCAYTAR